MIKAYYYLTKPGIIYGNAVTSIGGFFLAAKGHVDILLFFAMLLGMSLVIASACVINNFIDRSIDEKMERTKNRALVKHKISSRSAIIYAIILGLLGFTILIFYTNLLTAFIGLVGFFFYVVMYSIWKRKSIHGTLVGSISGAVPPVAGYCAASNQLDAGAIILFLILVIWQMPHFYAIAIFRLKDYANASIPVLPVKMGIKTTKIHILLYIVAFIVASFTLFSFGYVGYLYLVVMSLLGLIWLWMGLKGFKTENDDLWAKKMFRMSLIIITLFSVIISVEGFLK